MGYKYLNKTKYHYYFIRLFFNVIQTLLTYSWLLLDATKILIPNFVLLFHVQQMVIPTYMCLWFHETQILIPNSKGLLFDKI